MGWKRWPYWAKGGVILVLIYLMIIALLLPFIWYNYFFYEILIVLLTFPAILIALIIPPVAEFLGSLTFPFFSALVGGVSFALIFLIGALIGFIRRIEVWGKRVRARRKKIAKLRD